MENVRSELSKRATGKTIYILDEPTTGLHFEDVRKLLEVLQRLVEAGNTLVVIEHNLEVIKTADWIVDLGPEGGEVVVEGTPEAVAQHKSSHTARYLKHALENTPQVESDEGQGEARETRGGLKMNSEILEFCYLLTSATSGGHSSRIISI